VTGRARRDAGTWVSTLTVGALGENESFRLGAEIISLLHVLPQASVAGHDEVLVFIEARGLAGKGLGYIDVHLLAAAVLSGVPLWTLDRRLQRTARELHAAYGMELVAD